ncbi:MAG: hypothetical protein AB8B62_06575 [Roseobacter sp.]
MSVRDTELLAAHETADNRALVRLYAQAADESATQEAAGFYLTHAYVFALEAGLPEAPDLRARLIDMGRETSL